MNKIDFSDVLRKMRASFERVDRWFETAEKGKRADGVAEAWYELLKATERDDAMHAIEVLFADDNRPKAAEDYPLRIRKLAREIAAKRPRAKGPSGEATYECSDCVGRAWISVFADGTKMAEKYLEFYGEKARSIVISVRCGKCRQDSQEVEAYDPQTMVKATVREESHRAEKYGLPSREDHARAVESAGEYMNSMQKAPDAEKAGTAILDDPGAIGEEAAEREYWEERERTAGDGI